VEIKKAIITAAGKNQKTLPLQSLVDRDGVQRTALEILINEVLAAGIEEICIVISPGDRLPYKTAAGPHHNRLIFVEQHEPLGYGHAVHCAQSFTGTNPFLLLVGDHLYIPGSNKGCAQQLVELARAESCAVSAVQATHESKLPYYGTIGGRLLPNRQGVYQVDNVLEKPTPTEAEQVLSVAGLRSGFYLCFFGMHVLPASIMEILGTLLREKSPGNLHLTTALQALVRKERYLAAELDGRRYDVGVKYGMFTAQLALALSGREKEEIQSLLIEVLASRKT